MRKYLENTKTLWCLFGAIVVCAFIFETVKSHWGLTLIDTLYSPDEVRALLQQMTAEQRSVHAILTATLDVIFPLVLGGFLAGVAFRSFGNIGKYLAILPLLGIPLDLAEGVIQVLALTNTYDVIELKAIITPAKMAFFFAGFIVAMIAGIKWLVCKIKTVAKA